jgi:hypothetical protein
MRVKVRGSGLASPWGSRDALGLTLLELCPHTQFADNDLDKIYSKLGGIIGSWLLEQGRLNKLPLLTDLSVASNQMNAILQTLEGTKTGFHSTRRIELADQLRLGLAKVPAVGSMDNAHSVMQRFRELTMSMIDGARVAIDELKQQRGDKGRPSLGWYDDFTTLLVTVAKKAGTEPNLNINRITGEPEGWLFDAAQKLEAFLDKDMRSLSSSARLKRLQRSLKRNLSDD